MKCLVLNQTDGDLTQYLNKGINSITMTAGNISYLYSADGTKLRTVHGSNTTDYCGNFIYENGILSKVLIAEGYVKFDGTNSSFHYYLKDHQGNNRVVINYAGGVEQVNHYYPFGTLFAESTDGTVQKYKYNGKELDTTNNLNLYDYGARSYDSVLGIWTTQDPLVEKYYPISPYAYCGNNPVNRIDPDGREWKEKEDEEIAKQLQQQIASRDKSLAKQEQKINAQIDKIANNTKLSAEKRDQQIAKQQGRLEDVQTQRTQLSNLDKGITQLGDSKTSYTFNTVSEGVIPTLGSQSDGTIIINNSGILGNRAHETTHAIQYDNKAMIFSPLGSNNLRFNNSHPTGLEVDAYKVQYSISSSSMPSSDKGYLKSIFGITPDWVWGINVNGYYPYTLDKYK